MKKTPSINLINKNFLESKIDTINSLKKKYLNQNIYNKALITSQSSKILNKVELLQNTVDQFSSFALFEKKIKQFKTTSILSKKKKIGGFINFRKSFFVNSKNDYFQFHQDIFFIDKTEKIKNSALFLDLPQDITKIKNYPMLLVLKPTKGGFICYFFGLKGFYPRDQIKKSLKALLFDSLKIKQSKKLSTFLISDFLMPLQQNNLNIFKNIFIIRLPFNHFNTQFSVSLKKKRSLKIRRKFFSKKKQNRYYLNNIFSFDKEKIEEEKI